MSEDCCSKPLKMMSMSDFVATALENALQTVVKPKYNQMVIPNEQVTELAQEVSQQRDQLASINQWLTNLDERLGNVWVNTKTNVYHYKGQHWYGNTKQGAYECIKEGNGEGDRPTKNGQ